MIHLFRYDHFCLSRSLFFPFNDQGSRLSSPIFPALTESSNDTALSSFPTNCKHTQPDKLVMDLLQSQIILRGILEILSYQLKLVAFVSLTSWKRAFTWRNWRNFWESAICWSDVGSFGGHNRVRCILVFKVWQVVAESLLSGLLCTHARSL